MDETHNANMYRFNNSPWVTKFCIGLYYDKGMGIFLSENLADIIESAQLFGIAAAFANENSISYEVSIVMIFFLDIFNLCSNNNCPCYV